VSNWPEHVEPLDRAILGLLCAIPPRWKEIAYNELTSSEQEALRLMTRAGLVEERLRVRAWMDGFPQTVAMQFCVTGEYRNAEIAQRVLDTVPEWKDKDGRSRNSFHIQADSVLRARLTHEGDLAKHDYESDQLSGICAFVRKKGMFALRGTVKGVVRVESCEVLGTDAPGGRSSGAIVTASAQASASVGDIVIQNNISFDEESLGHLMEKLIESISKASAGAAQEAPDDGVASKDRPPRLWTHTHCPSCGRDGIEFMGHSEFSKRWKEYDSGAIVRTTVSSRIKDGRYWADANADVPWCPVCRNRTPEGQGVNQPLEQPSVSDYVPTDAEKQKMLSWVESAVCREFDTFELDWIHLENPPTPLAVECFQEACQRVLGAMAERHRALGRDEVESVAEDAIEACIREHNDAKYRPRFHDGASRPEDE